MQKIIDEYIERKEYTAKRKSANRGKRATESEIKQIIEDYLDGDPISDIAARLYRSPSFVNGIVQRVGIPTRPSGDERYKPAILPDECIAEEFKIGEIAWSAKYHSPCEIRQELDDSYTERYGEKCYRIYISEKIDEISPYFPQVERGGFNAYAPAYELGKLEHLTDYGVNVSNII